MINTCEREGTEAGLGRGRSQAVIEFQEKARTNPTGSSEAERGLWSCPELGVRALSPWVGQALGAQRRAHDPECSNSFETRQQLEGADSEDCLPVVREVSPLVWRGIWVVHPLSTTRMVLVGISVETQRQWALKLHLHLPQV